MSCRLCGSLTLKDVLTLHDMPSRAQYFSTQHSIALGEKTDIEVVVCSHCTLVQLTNDPVDYYKETIRSTNVSGSMRSFRIGQLNQFLNKYQLWEQSGIEVGCGFGDMLQIFKEINYPCDGLEENLYAVSYLKDLGFSISHGYPNYVDSFLSLTKYDVFFSFNVLEHSPNPLNYLRSVNSILRMGGFGMIEVPNFDFIKKNRLISEFMIEHLSYFDKSTFSKILELAGFEILSMNNVWHEYILSAEIRKVELTSFEGTVEDWEKLRGDLTNYLSQFPAETLCVWGAGHQSLTTVSLLGIQEFISFFVDASDRKQNHFAPGVAKPIFKPSVLAEQTSSIENVLVLAGSYNEEVIGLINTNFPNRFSVLQIKNLTFEILK